MPRLADLQREHQTASSPHCNRATGTAQESFVVDERSRNSTAVCIEQKLAQLTASVTCQTN